MKDRLTAEPTELLRRDGAPITATLDAAALLLS